MADNAMARLTFFISIFLIAFAFMMALLVALKISQFIIRRRLRRLIARDSQHDLVGRQGIVVRTIRQSRSGYISIDYQQNIYSFKAISDQKILAGALVTVTSVTPDGFHVSPAKQEQTEKSLYEQEKHSTLEKTVVQDINVETDQAELNMVSADGIPIPAEHGRRQTGVASKPPERGKDRADVASNPPERGKDRAGVASKPPERGKDRADVASKPPEHGKRQAGVASKLPESGTDEKVKQP